MDRKFLLALSDFTNLITNDLIKQWKVFFILKIISDTPVKKWSSNSMYLHKVRLEIKHLIHFNDL